MLLLVSCSKVTALQEKHCAFFEAQFVVPSSKPNRHVRGVVSSLAASIRVSARLPQFVYR